MPQGAERNIAFEQTENCFMNQENRYSQIYPKGRKCAALEAGIPAPDFTLKSTPDQPSQPNKNNRKTRCQNEHNKS